MENTARDITPADYVKGEDGMFHIKPEIRDAMWCRFIVALKKRAEQDGWTMRLIHETDNRSFPSVSIYPPGQENQSVLTSYRIEGGLPAELTPEQAQEPFVGYTLTIYTIKQRAVAGPLDFHLPAILLETKDFDAYAGGQAGNYDPVKWADHAVKMAKLTKDYKEEMVAIKAKYAGLGVKSA